MKTDSSNILEPLRLPLFRNIWTASLLSNMSLLALGVSAAWTMTHLTDEPDKVALVQTATMLPVAFFALPAGALADMYDRRIVSILALAIACAGAAGLSLASHLGIISIETLLAFCFIVAGGAAVFSPAWQAAVREQVPPSVFPAAVALSTISFNIARSFGPAVGGTIVSTAGSTAAFLFSAFGYLPMLTVMLLWKPAPAEPRKPKGGLLRSVIAAVIHACQSAIPRALLARTLLMALSGSAIQALMPLIVQRQLHATASIYGLMLGAFAVGAIVSAMIVPWARRNFDHELVIRTCLLVQALATAIIGASHSAIITGLALTFAGAGWMLATVVLNVGVQLSSPQGIAARMLAAFQTVVTAGMGIGGWIWGMVASNWGLQVPVFMAAGAMLLTAAAGIWLRTANVDHAA